MESNVVVSPNHHLSQWHDCINIMVAVVNTIRHKIFSLDLCALILSLEDSDDADVSKQYDVNAEHNRQQTDQYIKMNEMEIVGL